MCFHFACRCQQTSKNLLNNFSDQNLLSELLQFTVLPVAPSGTQWHPVAPSGTQWHPVAPSGTQWHPVAPSGTQWHPVAPSGTQWHPVAPSGTQWHLATPCNTGKALWKLSGFRFSATCTAYYLFHVWIMWIVSVPLGLKTTSARTGFSLYSMEALTDV